MAPTITIAAWLPFGVHGVLALAYFSMAAAIASLVRRRRDLSFKSGLRFAVLFGLVSGLLHASEFLIAWWPALGGFTISMGLISALLGVGAAGMLWGYLPRLRTGPSISSLTDLNQQLLHHSQELEQHIAERSSTLTLLNERLAAQLLDQQRTNRHLRAQANLLELSADGIMVCDEANRIIYWNAGAARLFGYKEEEARGRDADELLAAIYGQPLSQAEEELAAQGRWQGEVTMRHCDGRELVMSTRWAVDQRGEARYTLRVHSDVTAQKKKERALAASEARFRRLREAGILGIASVSCDGTICEANAAYLEMLGYSQEDVAAGDVTLQRISPVQWQEVSRNMLDIVRTQGVLLPYEKEYIRKDGGLVPVLVGAAYVEASKDIIGVVLDLSARCQMENQLATEKKQLQAILEQMPIGVMISDASTFQAVFSNDRFASLLGQQTPRGSLPAAINWQEFTRGSERLQTADCPLHRAIRSDQPVLGERAGYLQADGGQRMLSFNAAAIKDSRGEIVAGVLTMEDVTSEVEAARSLQESEGKFRLLANTMPQLSWMSDEHGGVVWFNQRWYDFSGLSFEEAAGWGWASLVHPDHSERVVSKLQHAISRRVGWEDSFPMQGQDKQWRWYLARAIPVSNDQNVLTGWLGTMTDITEGHELQMQLEQAKHAAEEGNRAKSTFLVNMSHELRTPLHCMLGFSELLADADSDLQERRLYVETVKRNGQNLARIIDDILDLSKIESGQLKLGRQGVEVRDLMNDMRASFALQCKEKALRIRSLIGNSVPSQVLTDGVRLRQILMHLIGNAVKFSEQADITVVVRWHEGRLSIAVRDRGPGMSAQEQGMLFQHFAHMDTSGARRQGGAGLGLALSRRLARALGGDLQLQRSVLDEGSIFLLTIAAAKPDDEGLPSSDGAFASSLPVQSQGLSGTTVLVVEDIPDSQLYMQRVLQKHGIEAELASDGEQAIERASQKTYDLVLMDMQMPVLDGYSAVATLRQQGYPGPIIALTAHAMQSEQEKAKQVGCTAHVAKPITPESLLEAIALYASKQPTVPGPQPV